MDRNVKAYVALVTTAALVGAAVLLLTNPGFRVEHLRAALWLVAFGVLSQLLSHKIRQGTDGSVASIPYLAAAVVAPSWTTAVAVLVGALVGETLRHLPPVKVVFNAAQLSLATSLAVAAYLGLGGTSLLRDASANWIAYSALVSVFFVTNTFAVSGVIAVSERRNILKVWRGSTQSSLLYDLMASPMAFALGWVYVRYGALGAAGLALPLLAVRQVFKTNWQLEQTTQELLELMVKAIEARDPYTSGHSQRVAHYSRIIGRAVGLHSRQIERLGIAALLHDVGKIHEIYAPLLRKTDKLTADEWVVMKTHPIKSAELVQTVSQLRDVVSPVRHHHEAWDGTGYPDGLAGDEIPLPARIIAIADTVDAMTTDRPYRAALGADAVRDELRRMSGRQFDPQLCDHLLRSPLFAALFGDRRPTPSNPSEARSQQQARRATRTGVA